MERHKTLMVSGIALSLMLLVVGGGMPHSPNSTEHTTSKSTSIRQNSTVPATNNQSPAVIPDGIRQKYGEVRNEFLLGNEWVVTTLGNQNSRGVIGIYNCSPKDTACLSGQKHLPLAAWKFYKPPFAGGVTLLLKRRDTLIVDNGGHQITFSISTHQWMSKP
ncbi:hypothetical protein [Alicyclobacillus sp. SO9]|uniref:hypothetical protein n=1 Tax=Alicyclobacillus sp. SO9 TaxID=2665646 RepID=UPI0018E80063|nr:hypothetical protein [Alicyclobacillus sp. SO9]QQE80003.1 hypothetical protein GI364_05895 [Alicyclobacillus sp. SO9]